MYNIVLTGGGTGGHVIPNISLIPHLKKHFKIFYIGSKNIEKELIEKEPDVEFKEISAVKFNRISPLKNLSLPFKLIKSVKEAKKLLREIKPKLVFSKGGYVSVPVCIGARELNIPIISHESDLSLGLANKLIYKLSSKFLTTFEKTSKNLKKAVFTGPPIRDELFSGNKEKALLQTNLDRSKPTILFVGGSTGAMSLNKIIYSSLKTLTQKYNVVHIVGKNKGDKKIKYPNYYQTEFVYNIQDYFALADIVVSRAGSNAICELLALNKPMILIPLSNKATRGDQLDNANHFKELGIATVLNESTLTASKLTQEIENMDQKKNLFTQKMNSLKNKNGTQNIINEILKFV